jgi:hypothetical protein
MVMEETDNYFYDENWESYDMPLSRYVPIMGMTTIAEALAFVRHVVPQSSPDTVARLEELVRTIDPIYAGAARPRASDRPARMGAPRQYGGAAPMSIHNTNPYMARILELVDAVHDFGSVKPPNARDRGKLIPEKPERRIKRIKKNVLMRRRMVESIRPVFPQELVDACSGYFDRDLDDLRKADPGFVFYETDKVLAFIACKKDIMKFMADSPRLTFQGTVVENDTLVGLPIDGITNPDADKVQPGIECVDIFFKRKMIVKDNKNEFVLVADATVLIELAELRAAMNDNFAGRENAAVLDVMIDQCMSVKQNREPSALFSWLTGFRVMIEALKLFFRKDNDEDVEGDEIYKPSPLRVHYCDAGMYDGLEVPKDLLSDEVVSNDVTGDVFHEQSEVRLEFVGPNSRKTYGYTVATLQPNLNPISWDEGRRDDTILVNDGKIVNKNYRRVTYDDSSTRAMVDMIEEMSDRNDDFRYAVPAALKRAGDWGQIEHCRQKGLIFVTSDALTAMYAVYRGVQVFFVKHYHKAVNGSVKFSFVMVSEDIVQAGGAAKSLRSMLPSLVLAAVILVMAVVSSA